MVYEEEARNDGFGINYNNDAIVVEDPRGKIPMDESIIGIHRKTAKEINHLAEQGNADAIIYIEGTLPPGSIPQKNKTPGSIVARLHAEYVEKNGGDQFAIFV